MTSPRYSKLYAELLPYAEKAYRHGERLGAHWYGSGIKVSWVDQYGGVQTIIYDKDQTNKHTPAGHNRLGWFRGVCDATWHYLNRDLEAEAASFAGDGW